MARSSSSSDPDDLDLERRALALRTPHSGYHFDGTGRRFFEGWYFKVTLPGEAQAFALIYSIEDPKKEEGGDAACPPSSKPGVGVQIMGPDDSYLIQYDADVSKFWARDPELALGACFEAKAGKNGTGAPPLRRQIWAPSPRRRSTTASRWDSRPPPPGTKAAWSHARRGLRGRCTRRFRGRGGPLRSSPWLAGED